MCGTLFMVRAVARFEHELSKENMANTQVLFYIIIVIVIVIKFIFWCLYLFLKNRKLRRIRERQNERNNSLATDPTCYEEVPAIPQPAFVFTGFVLPLPDTALTECLPEYQTDDPFKTDHPPPSYLDICTQRSSTASELNSFSELDTSDTQRLISTDQELDSGDG